MEFVALLRVYHGEEFGEFFKRPLAVFVGVNIVRPLLGHFAKLEFIGMFVVRTFWRYNFNVLTF